MREHSVFFFRNSGHEAAWSKESIAGMEELTRGQVLQAQVCGYAEDGLPVVYLYAIHGSQVRVF
jgi:A-kinase anchor protein 1